MDLSRYAARLSSAQESATELIKQEAGERLPERFGPASVGFCVLPFEPEDARLTGGTRSLSRRLLGLNLRGSMARTGTYKSGRDSSAA